MKSKKPATKKESLKTVNPSGKRDENFFQLVYDIVRQVPKGRVTSFGAVAAALGAKSAARMVGWAMNGSHRMKPKVPAQRVVNRQGLLSGRIHFDYPEQMQELLEKEGVKIKDNQVVDFEKKFWDPVKELGLE
jgi:methylated-DNA-protein-cysteine methyltransferase-like protein